MLRSATNPVNEPQRLVRLGSVSFLNAKPLIYGLENDPSLRIDLDVPSRLLSGLLENRFDVALFPVIDYTRMPGLRLLTAAGIGCDGPTLTVRIFSRLPMEQVITLACDTDSHTSVALAQIILKERYGRIPELVHLNPAGRMPEALLLIGDKVVCEEPTDYPHQLDLGQAWKELTGKPFVFAAWMAKENIEIGNLAIVLRQAKQDGLDHVNEIIRQHAVPRGWPPDIARQYLTQYLHFNIGPAQVEAIKLFHQKLAAHGLIALPVPELVTFEE